jgi:hypothetical protein
VSTRTELGRHGRSLDDLADAIGREWQLFEASARTTVGHAVRVGELLAEVKAQLAHGAWLPWLKQNTDIPERLAQRWMQLARTHAENPTLVSGMGVKAALAAIATPRTRAPRTLPAELLSGAERAVAEPAPAVDQLRRDVERTSEANRRQSFPRTGVERRTMRDIGTGLEDVQRSIESARIPGLIDWARADALRTAAKKARAVADELDDLADTVYPRRVR